MKTMILMSLMSIVLNGGNDTQIPLSGAADAVREFNIEKEYQQEFMLRYIEEGWFTLHIDGEAHLCKMI